MDDDLDLILASASGAPLRPSDALMARVLADAYDAQPQPVRLAVAAAAPAPHRGFFAVLSSALGGAAVMAGLGTAAVAGFFIGFADPSTLGWLTNDTILPTGESLELLPDGDLFLSEG